MIGQHMGQHVAGDQARQVYDPHAVERSFALGLVILPVHHDSDGGLPRRTGQPELDVVPVQGGLTVMA
ncbi:MAG: hypothetical protein NVS2B11_04290 [Acetobacteraceae bacterium]